MEKPIFFIGEELSDKTRQQIQYIEHPFHKIEKFVNGVFDAYLFFSPTGIDRFKLAGNCPNPNSPVFANENSTARAAWRFFTNKVHTSPNSEELSFVQYSIYHWMKENHYIGEHI